MLQFVKEVYEGIEAMCVCVCVCVMVLSSIPGARMCLVCLYQIHNFISNVLIRLYVRMWPGVRKTEMKREEDIRQP